MVTFNFTDKDISIEVEIKNPTDRSISPQITDAIIDSGSEISLLPKKIIKKMKLPPTDKVSVRGFGGPVIKIKRYNGTILINGIPFYFNQMENNLKFAENLDNEMILGLDFIILYRFFIDGLNKAITF